MFLIYIIFLVSLLLIVLDTKSTPAEKKLTSWNTGRIKMILATWTTMLVSSVTIAIHVWHSIM